MKKLVIFDLDGTLLDTLGDLCNAVNYTMAYAGRPARTIEEVRSFIGNGIKRLIELSLGGEFDDELVARCFDTFYVYYRQHYNELTVKYEGMDVILQRLIDKGISVGVVTNKLNEMANDLCQEHFGDCFVSVMGDVPDVPRKPDPTKVLKMMKDSDCDECILVGDSSVDINTAKNAGISCVAVSWGFQSRERLVSLEPDYIADNKDELEEILNQMLKI